MTRSFNRIILAAMIAGSATSAFAAASNHHPRAFRDFQAISQSSASDSQARPVETQAEKSMYDRTRLLSGY
jgi:hypothetical protein